MQINRRRFFGLLGSAAAACEVYGDTNASSVSASESPNPRAIGSQKQLFIDDDIIEEMSGLKRIVGQFEKHPANPLLKVDRPWEGQRLVEYDLIYDEEEKQLIIYGTIRFL